jgi:hypothetical protein
MDGYLNHIYAESLAEYGKPYLLQQSRGWILIRDIPGTSFSDAMSIYPLFMCEDWTKLNLDLNVFPDSIVSFTAVIDPFGNFNEELLQHSFPDLVMPFKTHFIIDLENYQKSKRTMHHKQKVKIAKQKVSVELCTEPKLYLDDWNNLYSTLILRHNIQGIRSFSQKSFEYQLDVPGIKMFRAIHNGQTVGMTIWYVINSVAYSHLSAYSELGYDCMASYALFDFSIDYFMGKLRWLNLGAGVGLNSNTDDGLTKFKKRWSTDTRSSYLCGKIINRELYNELIKSKGITGNDYFPLYRKGEFN